MRTYLLIFTLLTSLCALSQYESFADTIKIRKFFPQKYGHKRWKALIGFDAHRSFYSGKPVKFNGLRLGLEFKGIHRFGIGFYGIKENAEFTEIMLEFPDAPIKPIVRFNVTYSSLFYERVFYKTLKWEFAIPIYLAGGTVRGVYQDTSGTFQNFIDQPFSALGIGAQAKYYIWPWLAPRISLGYRITFNSNENIKQAFNNLYYSFGISINIGELYKAIFKRDQARKLIRTKIEEGEVKEGQFNIFHLSI